MIGGEAVVGEFDAAVESRARSAARQLAAKALADRRGGTQRDEGRAAFVLQQQVEDGRWRFVLGWVGRRRPASAPVPRAGEAPPWLALPSRR